MFVDLLFKADIVGFEINGQQKILRLKHEVCGRTPREAALRIRVDTFRKTRDTVSKLSQAGFEDSHRIRICEGCRFTMRCWPRVVVDLKVTRTQVLVGFVLMPSTCPWCTWFVVLNAELIALGMWTPLELERRFASIQILVKEDSAIEGPHCTDWTHRTWFSVNGRHASFPSKSSCYTFVDLISVEMRVSRNRCVPHFAGPASVGGYEATLASCLDRIV